MVIDHLLTIDHVQTGMILQVQQNIEVLPIALINQLHKKVTATRRFGRFRGFSKSGKTNQFR